MGGSFRELEIRCLVISFKLVLEFTCVFNGGYMFYIRKSIKGFYIGDFVIIKHVYLLD